MNLLEVYLLNLAVTAAMFLVLIFRAWIEFKNFKAIWKEMEWRRTRQTAKEVLKAEKETFLKMEDGKELYDILCHMFEVDED
ncbi:hypothetical protein B6U79_00905 [Candidatus Bathyarchaeota archaeon ex4484_231]|nr:MAG: hypothetical protein B6U79_00905 [Candidatus Bathyarchaeota archaeon ex4484_231]RJS75847.1 MAG: hypothetical protein CW712_03335 [Candidatus Bathyarchaeota archaeon]